MGINKSYFKKINKYRYAFCFFMFPHLCFGLNLCFDHFSIEAPDGWISAPEEKLREYEKSIELNTGKPTSYIFGIQPSGRDVYFMEPPFILCSFRSNDKISEDELQTLSKELNKHLESTDISEAPDSENALLKSIFDVSTFGKLHYDSNTKCVWSTMTIMLPKFRTVK